MKGFNVENILIDSDQKVFLLDFDKAVQMDPSNSMAQKNINRLQRSLNKNFSNPSKSFPKAEWEILITEHSKQLNQD